MSRACEVEFGVAYGVLGINVPLEYVGKDARPASPESVVKHGQPICKVYLSGVAIKEGEVELTEDKDDILVEVITNEQSDPPVSPATVGQHKLLEEFELPDSVVGRANSLGAFLSSNADSNVCFENHWHIIRAISD